MVVKGIKKPEEGGKEVPLRVPIVHTNNRWSKRRKNGRQKKIKKREKGKN